MFLFSSSGSRTESPVLTIIWQDTCSHTYSKHYTYRNVLRQNSGKKYQMHVFITGSNICHMCLCLELCKSHKSVYHRLILAINSRAYQQKINLSRWLTCVEHLFDDDRHLTLQHGVQQLDDQNEAGTESQQWQSQQNQPHGQVRKISEHKHVSTWRERWGRLCQRLRKYKATFMKRVGKSCWFASVLEDLGTFIS